MKPLGAWRLRKKVSCYFNSCYFKRISDAAMSNLLLLVYTTVSSLSSLQKNSGHLLAACTRGNFQKFSCCRKCSSIYPLQFILGTPPRYLILGLKLTGEQKSKNIDRKRNKQRQELLLRPHFISWLGETEWVSYIYFLHD